MVAPARAMITMSSRRVKPRVRAIFWRHLRAHASARGLFGGALDFDKLGFFERAVVKKVAGVSQSVFKVDREAIDAFAAALGGD